MFFVRSQHSEPFPSPDDRRRKDLSRTKPMDRRPVECGRLHRGRNKNNQSHRTKASPTMVRLRTDPRTHPLLETYFSIKPQRYYMTIYLILSFLWTMYMALETYIFGRPQSRPHFVGFLIVHTLLAPVSFVLSATSGVLRERIETTYRAAWASKRRFARTDRKKLIG